MEKTFLSTAIAIVGPAFAATGVLLLFLSFYFRYRTKRFISESTQADGDVIGLKEVHSEDGVMYAPIIRFTSADGVEQEFTDSVSSRPARYNVGDRIEILYNQLNPTDAKVATTFRLYFDSNIVGLLSAIFLIIGVAMTIGYPFLQG